MEKICMWADGSWCYEQQIKEFRSMGLSDDYRTTTVPDDIEEWEVDGWVEYICAVRRYQNT